MIKSKFYKKSMGPASEHMITFQREEDDEQQKLNEAQRFDLIMYQRKRK